MRNIIVLLLLLLIAWPAAATDAAVIDRRAQETLGRLYATKPGVRSIVQNAAGVLVYPRVYKAGIGIGGDYGEGVLLEHGRRSGYYNLVSGSIGFQLGAQLRSQVFVFTDPAALTKFKATDGWKVGVDGSAVIAEFGAGGTIDTNTANKPVIVFVLGEKGLMYNINLEGSKITRIER
ncbi:MAG: YSC84-related protein [Xanthomonadales bacterium]|nr:YSC84-related protein [Xanthomonadales bacterium]MDZ4114551.1 YSC84-related protein [Xanthomonadaceae bacterium]